MSLEEQAFGNFLKFKVIKASAPPWAVKSEVVLMPKLCSIWSARTNIYWWCQGRMEAHFHRIKVSPSSQTTTNYPISKHIWPSNHPKLVLPRLPKGKLPRHHLR
jgi:hypothetical protein